MPLGISRAAQPSVADSSSKSYYKYLNIVGLGPQPKAIVVNPSYSSLFLRGLTGGLFGKSSDVVIAVNKPQIGIIADIKNAILGAPEQFAPVKIAPTRFSVMNALIPKFLWSSELRKVEWAPTTARQKVLAFTINRYAAILYTSALIATAYIYSTDTVAQAALDNVRKAAEETTKAAADAAKATADTLAAATAAEATKAAADAAKATADTLAAATAAEATKASLQKDVGSWEVTPEQTADIAANIAENAYIYFPIVGITGGLAISVLIFNVYSCCMKCFKTEQNPETSLASPSLSIPSAPPLS